MNDPIVFISRNRLREGMLAEFSDHYRASVPATQAGKPNTLLQLAYVDPHAGEVAIVRLFASPEAMETQLQGADQRSKVTYRFIEPVGMELFGEPGAAAVETINRISGSGVPVRLHPRYIGGFIRARLS